MALLGVCLAAGPARAASSTTGPAPGSTFGYALTAVGFRSFFVFDARPGQTVKGNLGLVNLTPAPKTIVLYPSFVSTAATGGLQYNHSKQAGATKWLHLSQTSVRLGGAQTVEVPFTVRVPPVVRAGDLFTGIVAVDRRALAGVRAGRGPIQLRIIPRLAMTIQLRVPGRRTAKLTPGGAAIQVSPAGAWLTLQITNLGNTLLPATSGTVTIYQGSTALFSQDINLAAFVPRTHIVLQLPWNGRPVEGRYVIRGELRPTGAPPVRFQRTVVFARAKINQYRNETGRPATTSSTSDVLVIALGLALLGTAFFAVAYARARRRLSGGAPPG